MLHVGLASMLLCLMTTEGPAPAAVVQTARQDILAEKLRDTVNFDGFDDPKMTLQDALEYLTDRYDLTFDLDEAAFARAGVKKALASEIVKELPIPKMRGVLLDGVLDKILSRLPASSEATYLIQRRGIVITTKRAASKAVLGDEDLPLPPLVHRRIENQPLKLALNDIAGLTDTNVVLDDSVAEKAGESISARFVNAPVDTAVRILADRYGFTSFRIDNVIYVTSRDKAAKLREDIEKEKRPRGRERMPLADEKPIKKSEEK